MDTPTIQHHFDTIAKDYDFWKKKSWYYYSQIKDFFTHHIPPQKKVLEVGCGTGDILASTKPKVGYGFDISREMVNLAKQKHPMLHFFHQSIYALKHTSTYDYIIVSDVIDHLPDIFTAFQNLKKVCTTKTLIVISTVNPVWGPVMEIGEKLKQKMPEGPHNFVPHDDLCTIIENCGFKIVKHGFHILIPIYIPYISDFINARIDHFGFLKKFAFGHYIICTKKAVQKRPNYSCSIIIPAYNESENINDCIKQIPTFPGALEIIVVNDGSTDATQMTVQKIMRRDKRVQLISYETNYDKAHAIQRGFQKAKGDIVIILDADMAVPPEETKYFYTLLQEEKAAFVNGTRMIYPMEKQAMRYLHLFGNKIFSLLFSWILNQRVTDTLCGTKALFRKDALKIQLGNEPWGDFDLLFGAVKQGLVIKEFPVHYQKRHAGESKMHTFRHGFRLLYMCFIGLFKLKISPHFIK